MAPVIVLIQVMVLNMIIKKKKKKIRYFMSNSCLLLIMVQINVTDLKLFRNTQSAALLTKHILLYIYVQFS